MTNEEMKQGIDALKKEILDLFNSLIWEGIRDIELVHLRDEADSFDWYMSLSGARGY